MPKRIAILGSTGSIGCNTVEVIQHLGSDYRATAICGHRQIDKLFEQAKQLRPAAIGVADDAARDSLESKLRDARIDSKIYVGSRGICEMVQRDDVDIVVAAIVGFAGLAPVLSAIEAGKTIALANKESLVVAGSIIMPLARKHGVQILPVDSEHSAIFQSLAAGKKCEIARIILTASGGPFREWSIEKMRNATKADALNHPVWRMGDKVTIDSSTMFNKALEVIEACWLFDVPPEKIQVVIHPESVVHSMVEFVDGSTIAQLSPPDMRTPIQFALTWPERKAGISRRLDLTRGFSLNFQPPDLEKFAALPLAFDVAKRKGSLGAVLNAANEAAVDAFVAGRVRCGAICDIVRRTIDAHDFIEHPTLDDLINADRWARETAEKFAATFANA